MKKKQLKNLALNKKSISKLAAPESIVGGNVNTIQICYKSKNIQGGNICFKSVKNCWQTQVNGCVPNTYQVNTDTIALC
jgi:hypothetical protein